jgi:lactose/L-arabinose transport system substrate-binding protein
MTTLTRRAALAAALAAPHIARAQSPTRITYWCWSEHARGARAVLPKFREQNPDIDVNIVNLNPQEIQDKLLIAMATGTGAPDVGLIIESRFPTYPPTGGLLDVTDRIAAARDDVEPRLWQRLHHNGRAYGVPYINNSAVIFVRRDILARVGATAPVETWPEWLEIGRRIRALEGDIRLMQVSPGVPGFGPLAAYLESAGIQIFDEAGKVVRRNARAAEQLRFYFELGKPDGVGLLVRHNSPEHFVAIKTGKLAALHSGNWGLDRLEQEAPDDRGKWGVMPWPRWTASAPPWTGTWGGSVLAIPRRGRNLDAAVKWAVFLGTDTDAQIGLWQNGYGFPTSLKARRDPRIAEAQPYLGQSMYEASLKPRETQYFNLVRDWPRVQVAMGRELDLMFSGRKAPEAAWTDFENEMAAHYG